MKLSWKADVTILFTLAVVVIAALMPARLFSLWDHSLYAATHERQKNENKLDLNVAKIAQVKSIHELYSPSFEEEEHSVANAEQVVKQEIQVLCDEGIFTQEYADSVRENPTFGEGGHSILFPAGAGPNIPNNIFNTITFRDGEGDLLKEGAFILDPFTQKIISVDIQARNLDYLKALGTNELIAAYISYLGLEVIEDWRYSEGLAVSQAADLRVSYSIDSREDGVSWINLLVAPLS